MKYLEKIEDMLCDELQEISSQGKLTVDSLDKIDKLTHSLKSIETIMAMDDYSNEGPMGGNSNNYSREGSYSRRGRYSRRSNGRYSRDDYSYNDGKEDMIEELQDMMEDAGSEKEREAIRHCISQMQK